jgi:tellurite resistance protein TerC
METVLPYVAMLWLGMPVWIWLGFVGIVISLLAFDLGVLHREAHEIGVRESLVMSAFYIGLGLLFAAAVWWIYASYDHAGALDSQIAGQATVEDRAWTAVKLYITGYLVEKTLAMDNVFVISMIFAYFAVPRIYQHRVLFWGILGVIALRAIMIGLGAALVMEFAWIMYFFAVVLVATGVKMLVMMDQKPDIANNPVLKFLRKRLRVTDELQGQRFFVRLPDSKSGKIVIFATPLFFCLALIEVADVVFAIDSVPAIFALTSDPFIVYTSNIFAILGLRALYFALAAMVHRFHYLKYALALVLIFIGSKIFLGDFLWDGKMPAEISLSVTGALLAGGVLYSLWKTQGAPARVESLPPGAPAGGLLVRNVMTANLITIAPEASIGEAASLMAASGVTGLPVVDGEGRLMGVVTEGDLLRREELGNVPDTPLWRTLFTDDDTLARAFAKAYGRRVREAMSRDLKTVAEDMALGRAAEMLFRLKLKRLPVMRGDKLIGILSRSDVIRALGRLGKDLSSRAATDAEIRDELAARIGRAGWISPQQVTLAVRDGAVEIAGNLTSEDQRAALVALAEGVVGVKAVRDGSNVTRRLAARPA